MKKILFFFGALIYTASLFAQGDNCADPIPVNLVCPTTVSFAGETTAGFTNDISSWGGYAANGRDKVYEVTVPTGSLRLLVSITATTGALLVISTNNICSGSYTYRNYGYTSSNLSIPVSGAGPYYIWIDHNYATDITYSIGFGVITSTTPNTLGFWTTSNNCISPITKPNLEIKYNGIHQDLPLYYSPLSSPGQVCATFYFQNLTGEEGVKRITFSYGPSLSGFAPTIVSMPGFYNAGTWNATSSGNMITWTFADAAGLGRGDFTGAPNSCLAYTFCFNFTPLSNDPIGTLVTGSAYSDRFGYPKDNGCCPTSYNCSAAGTSSGSSIGFAFDDPPLPVTLMNFDLKKESGYNLLHWETSSENNSSRFEIERSEDNNEFVVVGSIEAAGESNQLKSYSWKDVLPVYNSYYRLKQIDKDGSFQYSKIVFAESTEREIILQVYPSPASEFVYIECAEEIYSIQIYNAMGKYIVTWEGLNSNNKYDISSLTKGIYFLSIQLKDQYISRKMVVGND